MRTLMPALQKAKPVAMPPGGAMFERVSLPAQRRETRVVKDRSTDEIAREIVAWIAQG